MQLNLTSAAHVTDCAQGDNGVGNNHVRLLVIMMPEQERKMFFPSFSH